MVTLAPATNFDHFWHTAVTKARNLQNFFPFPQQKEALEDDHTVVTAADETAEKSAAICHMLRLFLGNGFTESLSVEDLRGLHHSFLQEVSWEEFGRRKSGIVEVHEGLEGDKSPSSLPALHHTT